MEKEYGINGCGAVLVQFDHQIVRLPYNDGLQCTVKDWKIDQLVQYIKDDYAALYKKRLNISDHSLEVEIWGHVYLDRLCFAIARKFKWKLTQRLYALVQGHCSVIDCGERAVDKNRVYWNLLSKMKWALFAIFKRLP